MTKKCKNGICELCGVHRELTFHHLVPRKMHKKSAFLKKYTKKEMQSNGLNICRICHSGIHDLFDEKELGESYHTKDLLLSHEGVIRHISWSSKQR